MIQENRKFISYTGVLGRKTYFLYGLAMYGTAWFALAITALVVHFSGGAMSLENSGLNHVTLIGLFGMALVGWYVLLSGLIIRRVRDLLDLRNNDVARDTAIMFGFIATSGFFLIGYLALLFWPGVLSKQETAKRMMEINKP